MHAAIQRPPAHDHLICIESCESTRSTIQCDVAIRRPHLHNGIQSNLSRLKIDMSGAGFDRQVAPPPLHLNSKFKTPRIQLICIIRSSPSGKFDADSLHWTPLGLVRRPNNSIKLQLRFNSPSSPPPASSSSSSSSKTGAIKDGKKNGIRLMI